MSFNQYWPCICFYSYFISSSLSPPLSFSRLFLLGFRYLHLLDFISLRSVGKDAKKVSKAKNNWWKQRSKLSRNVRINIGSCVCNFSSCFISMPYLLADWHQSIIMDLFLWFGINHTVKNLDCVKCNSKCNRVCDLAIDKTWNIIVSHSTIFEAHTQLLKSWRKRRRRGGNRNKLVRSHCN